LLIQLWNGKNMVVRVSLGNAATGHHHHHHHD
jgi:hypothetical protein